MPNNAYTFGLLKEHAWNIRSDKNASKIISDAADVLRAAGNRIADLESCIVWLVDNIDIDMRSGDPEIAWPGFELVGDMTGDDIVEAVKRAKEASNGK